MLSALARPERWVCKSISFSNAASWMVQHTHVPELGFGTRQDSIGLKIQNFRIGKNIQL